MENTSNYGRPEARIIHLHIPETPKETPPSGERSPELLSRFTLAYIDELLDEHFR